MKSICFNLTPRRRDILCHIAFDDQVVFGTKQFFCRGGWRQYPLPELNGVNIAQICQVMRRHKLIRWPMESDIMWITPKGIDLLLSTIK